MSFQRQAPAQQTKEYPPIELSMKYAAWDIKAIPPAIKELTDEIRALRLWLSNSKGAGIPDVPF